MRIAVALLALAVSLPALAKDRVWQDGKLVQIVEQTADGGEAWMLVFGTLQRVPITHDRRCYQIDTDGIQYMLATTNSKPLNLTLHENVRISVGRMKALVIDDSGKRVKLEVLAKKLK